MKKIKIMTILITIIATSLTTGCYDYREVNQLSVVSALAIDKEGSDYRLTASLVKVETETSGSGGAQGKIMPITMSTTGKTIFECLRKMTLQSPKRLYINHISLLLVQEEIAKEGLNKVYDFLLRDQESRAQFSMLISKEETAGEILTILPSLNNLPAEGLIESIEDNARFYGIATVVNYDEINSIIFNDGVDPVISSVRIIGDKIEGQKEDSKKSSVPLADLVIDSLGVFKIDKLRGWLTDEESQGLNFITNKVENSIINIPCLNNKEIFMNIEIIRSKTKLIAKLNNNIPSIDVVTEMTANIAEVDCNLQIDHYKIIEQIENQAAEKLAKMFSVTILKLQEYGSDALGFGRTIYHKYPQYWKKNKDDWYEIYPEVNFKIKINIEINNVGLIKKPMDR